jgi:hypothetical protein
VAHPRLLTPPLPSNCSQTGNLRWDQTDRDRQIRPGPASPADCPRREGDSTGRASPMSRGRARQTLFGRPLGCSRKDSRSGAGTSGAFAGRGLRTHRRRIAASSGGRVGYYISQDRRSGVSRMCRRMNRCWWPG